MLCTCMCVYTHNIAVRIYLDEVLWPPLAQHTPTAKPVSVTTILCHTWSTGGIP